MNKLADRISKTILETMINQMCDSFDLSTEFPLDKEQTQHIKIVSDVIITAQAEGKLTHSIKTTVTKDIKKKEIYSKDNKNE